MISHHFLISIAISDLYLAWQLRSRFRKGFIFIRWTQYIFTELPCVSGAIDHSTHNTHVYVVDVLSSLISEHAYITLHDIAHLSSYLQTQRQKHVCWCYFWCTGSREVISNQNETSCLLLLNAGFEPRVSGTESPADWILADKPIELSRVKLKKNP